MHSSIHGHSPKCACVIHVLANFREMPACTYIQVYRHSAPITLMSILQKYFYLNSRHKSINNPIHIDDTGDEP